MRTWMIYGANGYTGELIAREAAARGLQPILAGRTAARLEPLGRELGLPVRAFSLDDPASVVAGLESVAAVLHCAGPFVHTSRPMVDACIASGTHYLDITGEIAVFESIFARDAEATRRGVALIPGVGFDVVPTDCLAASLSARMPDATELWLALNMRGGRLSRGTLKTMLESIGEGGAIRQNGTIVRVPIVWDVTEIPFPSGPRKAVTIPWGDIATAWSSTGIANIRVYVAASDRDLRQRRWMQRLLPIVSLGPVRRFLQKRAERQPGPDEATRNSARVEVWGRVTNHAGRTMTAALSTPEGYRFTMLSALAAVETLLATEVRGGAFTPSRYFGADFVRKIPGVQAAKAVTAT